MKRRFVHKIPEKFDPQFERIPMSGDVSAFGAGAQAFEIVDPAQGDSFVAIHVVSGQNIDKPYCEFPGQCISIFENRGQFDAELKKRRGAQNA